MLLCLWIVGLKASSHRTSTVAASVLANCQEQLYERIAMDCLVNHRCDLDSFEMLLELVASVG